MTHVEPLEPGTRVLVYEEPLAHELPEGYATIVQFTGRTGPDGLWYDVRFDGTEETVPRKLYEPVVTDTGGSRIDVVGQRFEDELLRAKRALRQQVQHRAATAGVKVDDLRFTLEESRALYEAGYHTGHESGADGGSFEQALLDLDSFHR